jgi:hypothetical protein
VLVDMLRLALFFLLAAVETAAGQSDACTIAVEESARATLQFLNAVAGVKQPKACDPTEAKHLAQVLAAAEKARSAVLSANRACGHSSDKDSDSHAMRLIDVVKKRIAECEPSGGGSTK